MGYVLGLALVPLMMFVGSTVDYARGVAIQSRVQDAADRAALAAASGPSASAQQTAAALVDATLSQISGFQYSTAIAAGADQSLTVSVTGALTTTFMQRFLPTLPIVRSATARSGSTSSSQTTGGGDTSCIFSLGETLNIGVNTLTFNGSPNVNLTGCSLRSNKSMRCNGGSTGAQSYAVGEIVGCSNPNPGQPVTPDIHQAIASNISLECGATKPGVRWSASATGDLPSGAGVLTVARSGYTEIHICGNLELSGASGETLTGANPAQDIVVVIENGGIVITDGAQISARRITFVLASGDTSSNKPIVSWPNGNGGNAASIALTASTASSNPWKGIAVYQSPALNAGADMTWRSGTTFSVDGILYFPNAQLTVSGQVTAGPTGCAKLIVGEFTLNGAVDLRQSAGACATMQVAQYTTSTTVTSSATGVWLSR